MDVQWYPGHMTRAMRDMKADCRLVDLIIELVDARVPASSRNPDIDKLGQGKSRLILMNKADLADPEITDRWQLWFESCDIQAVALDSRSSAQMKAVNKAIDRACALKKERDIRRGISNRPVRAMVVGIPNVGKSTFINTFAGHTAARTGNKPGVTKGDQWIRLNKKVELLDTPGVLWPKFEDEQAGVRLAAIGSVNDEILDLRELCGFVVRFLSTQYPGTLSERYPCEDVRSADGHADISCEISDSEIYRVLTGIAQLRGCLGRGAEPDLDKAARVILDDFRSGRLGRVTLEAP